ncbi:SDR family oxidoreductase [Pseudoxanthomonas japonensis]|jgi:short-subunit dehydrogenase|uniref:Short chain dehydrogenase n=1 Tax=Pseudoxanthomonas japonensis TaxID=69284 RepID=A0ABQ6ZFU5_9GAMM|nr:SDR family oxidoreductase [Pseudoxanthomonas japonensis]KAF1724454.1 short chain dehydrogenase [Pseudoxanthomonas japonensis]NCT72228.1 SDR family oxidoreductase [Xanthomonadaceae bacterium]
MDLAGRTVMVTGASGGIGAPLCAALVAAGAQVLAVGRDEARLQHVAQALPTGRVTCVAADVSTPAGRERLLQAARAAQPTPSVLVLAHAQAAFGLFDEQSPDAMAQLMHTNLVAPMLLLHGMLPVLLAHASASVVVVGSTFGSLAFPGFAAYSASKFGLRGLTEALAREYADTPLRFQYLSPRATRTPFNTAAVDALNAELKVASDAPGEVARQLVAAIAQGTSRLQVGWPEKLFARLNGLAPGLVDRNLRASLPIVRRHARRPRPSTAENARHEVPSLR